MRAAAVQLNSTGDYERNLEVAERLVRDAAGDGADLVVLPEKWTVLGDAETLRAAAQPLDGPALTAAAGWARELGIHLVAGSIAERVPGQEKLSNTSVLLGPDGERLAVYRKIHMFDVDVDEVAYRESAAEEPGDEIVVADAGGVPLGLTVCYDLRFPELYRILALREARVVTVPSAFTERTGRDHWEVLLRARAVENQVFIVAADQIGEAPPHYRSFGRSLIADPWGVVLAEAPDRECFVSAELDFSSQDRIRQSLPSLANRREGAYRWPFHSARVSDVASEAGVAYGLVYHYFDSKDQMLNELFTERWSLLLDTSEKVQEGGGSVREKLGGVAGFIIESYRHEPDLMKVIIVEVTRAANSFGRTHLAEIRQAYELIEKIVADAQAAGEFRKDVSPAFASMLFYGAIEQLLTGWIFEVVPGADEDFEHAKELVVETICGGLEPRPAAERVPG